MITTREGPDVLALRSIVALDTEHIQSIFDLLEEKLTEKISSMKLKSKKSDRMTVYNSDNCYLYNLPAVQAITVALEALFPMDKGFDINDLSFIRCVGTIFYTYRSLLYYL